MFNNMSGEAKKLFKCLLLKSLTIPRLSDDER